LRKKNKKSIKKNKKRRGSKRKYSLKGGLSSEQVLVLKEELIKLFSTIKGYTRGSKNRKEYVIIDGIEYEIGKELGRGGFGIVSEITSTIDGNRKAMKVIDLEKIKSVKMIISEIQILQKLIQGGCKANILCYEGFYIKNNTLILITEVLNGYELESFMFGKNKTLQWNDEKKKKLIHNICRAVLDLHIAGVAHRDIKPQNIILLDTDEFNIKIIDFGLAYSKDSSENDISISGTPRWMDPEIVRRVYNRSELNTSDLWKLYRLSDLWSTAILVFTLIDLSDNKDNLLLLTNKFFDPPYTSLYIHIRDNIYPILQCELKRYLYLSSKTNFYPVERTERYIKIMGDILSETGLALDLRGFLEPLRPKYGKFLIRRSDAPIGLEIGLEDELIIFEDNGATILKEIKSEFSKVLLPIVISSSDKSQCNDSTKTEIVDTTVVDSQPIDQYPNPVDTTVVDSQPIDQYPNPVELF